MTTIVGVPGCIVSDTQVTYGGVITTQEKILRVRDFLVATSGDCELGDEYIEYLRRRRGKRPAFKKKDKRDNEIPRDDEFEALIVNRQGLFVVSYDCRPRRILQPFHAIGAGAMAALGALHMGASPEQAVTIACTVNKPESGLPLQVVHLCPASKTKNSTPS